MPTPQEPEGPRRSWLRRHLNPHELPPRMLVLKGLFCLALAIFIMDRVAHVWFWPAPDATEILLVSSERCPHSRAVRAHLTANDIAFREIEARRDPFASGMASWAFQSLRVPIVVVGPEIIHGNREHRIDVALADLGYTVSR